MPSESDERELSVPAAQYLRTAVKQQSSVDTQREVIRKYATSRGYRIVETYADEGKSGARLEGREALQKLIEDVESGNAPFKAILTFDISRLSRSQDAVALTLFEQLCERAGIAVHFCAGKHEDDADFRSSIIKCLKQAMEGEYSGGLSSRVFRGQCRLAELGYRQGGPPGYGLRRMLIDQNAQHKGVLQRGEYKSLQTDRVILVPGPEEEIRVVNWIYRMFTKEGKSESQIAAILTSEGYLTDLGRPWTRATVRQVLTNEKYIGCNVYNRQSFKLEMKRVRNPPEMWVRADGAFEAIVSPELFYTARAILQSPSQTTDKQDRVVITDETQDEE